MSENFENQNQNEDQPEKIKEKSQYIEPHDEIYKQWPDDIIINDWWTNLPGGRKKIGDMIDEPIEDYYRKRAKKDAGKYLINGRYETEEELYSGFVGGQFPKSEKRLKLSDYEFKAIVEQKMREAGINIAEIMKMNERMNEIDAMPQRTEEVALERDKLLQEMEVKTGVVRRMLLREGFSIGDLSVS